MNPNAEVGTSVPAEEVAAFLRGKHPLAPDVSWIVELADRYVLTEVPLSRLRVRPARFWDTRLKVDLFRERIERGSDPTPIICDLTRGTIIDGRHRALALQEAGREIVRAWVATYENGCPPPGLAPTMLL